MYDGRCKISESLDMDVGAVEPGESSKSNPNQSWALNAPTKDCRNRPSPTLLFVCPLVFAAPHAYPKRAVPATGDMNNPSHSSERVKKCMLDLDSRPGACCASPEAKLDLGWTALMLGLPECEMFMVWTL